MIYFAKDGSYGDADGLLIVDPSKYTAQQWLDIVNASDMERVQVVIDIERGNSVYGDNLS